MRADYQSRFGNTIPLHYWHLKSDAPEKVQALFAEFPQMLDFFEATVGPFPFGDEKMGVVETPHLGMEHQTINAYGNAYKIEDRGYDTLLQHEFSHEWFANQLTNRNADDMWLHEGLGSYMQPLYARWLLGDRYMQRELANQREGLINKYPVVSGTPKTEDEVYKGDVGPGLDIYNKGSQIAHSLRMLIGDEAFFRSVTRLVYGTATPRPGEFRPRYGTTPEFLALYDLDPATYGAYPVVTQHNVQTTVRMTGLDFEYKQALTFLPQWARGVQVFATASVQRTLGDESANFAGFTPRTFNWGKLQ